MTKPEATQTPAGPRPLVSVLMPSFNHEAYVAQAVASVWHQTHRPLELIAIDDGSTDRTAEILERLARRSPIPMAVHRQENRGIAAALNTALEHASGEWVSVLASDDAYREDKVERQLETVGRRPRCLAVHSDYLCVGPGGDPRQTYQGARLPAAAGCCHRDLLYGLRTVHSVTLMVRTHTMRELGGWDERYPQEDWPLILRLSRSGEIAYCPRRLVLRRVHRRNLSRTMSRRRVFSPDDAGVDLLRQLCDSPRELEICASIHVSVVMRNSLAQRGWRRAAGAFAYAWREFPGRRLYVLGQAMSGLRSLAWLHLARPLLPRRLVERLSAARAARLEARATSGTTDTGGLG